MCGIVGYVGIRPGSVRLALDSLKKLYYRGYDSAGIAVVQPNSTKVTVLKKQGKLENLEASLNGLGSASGTVIAHTRWATHGTPNDTNAHPHCDCSGQIALIHNGIIENYLPLRERLIAEGHKFTSETDTEVVVHLIEAHAKIAGNTMEDAIRNALKEVTGAYAICVISEQEPNTIYAAKTSSPLAIGLGDGENFLASDVPSVMEYTRQFLVMDDGEFAKITSDAVILTTLDGSSVTRHVFHIPRDWNMDTGQKDGYPHFLLKEIHGQPGALRNTMFGRISKTNTIILPELAGLAQRFSDFNRIVIVGAGSAYHAAMVGKRFFEHLLRLPVEACAASEFRYSDPIIDQHTLVIVISQSGETPDTLMSLFEAKERGAATLALVHVIGSTMARRADEVVYAYAGVEHSVPCTKSYLTQLVTLYLVGLYFAQENDALDQNVLARYVGYLKALPNQVAEMLHDTTAIEQLAHKLANSSSILFLGRGIDFPICLQAALLMKQVAEIHAEAYLEGEMKHGAINLIDQDISVVSLITQSVLMDKFMFNRAPIQAREAFMVAIIKENEQGLPSDSVNEILRIPNTHETFTPILSVVPMQLLAYYIAVKLNREIEPYRRPHVCITVD